jgi:hypothetical protein
VCCAPNASDCQLAAVRGEGASRDCTTTKSIPPKRCPGPVYDPVHAETAADVPRRAPTLLRHFTQ